MVFEGIVCGEIRLLVTCHEPPFFGDQQTRLDMVLGHQNSTILNDLIDLLQEWGLFQQWFCWFCSWQLGIGCREGVFWLMSNPYHPWDWYGYLLIYHKNQQSHGSIIGSMRPFWRLETPNFVGKILETAAGRCFLVWQVVGNGSVGKLGNFSGMLDVGIDNIQT